MPPKRQRQRKNRNKGGSNTGGSSDGNISGQIAGLANKVKALNVRVAKIPGKNGKLITTNRSLDNAGLAYYRSLLNPFGRRATVRLPDVCVAKSSVGRLNYKGVLSLDPSLGTIGRGYIVCIPATGSGGSAGNTQIPSAGFCLYPESQYQPADHSWSYGYAQSTPATENLYTVAEAIRIVSAELRVEATPNALNAVLHGWVKSRTNVQTDNNLDGIRKLSSYATKPLSEGISIRYFPLDNADFEFGETQDNTGARKLAQRDWNLAFHVSMPQAVQGASALPIDLNFEVAVNVEYIPKSDTQLLATATPSPVSSTFAQVMNNISGQPAVQSYMEAIGEAAGSFASRAGSAMFNAAMARAFSSVRMNTPGSGARLLEL